MATRRIAALARRFLSHHEGLGWAEPGGRICVAGYVVVVVWLKGEMRRQKERSGQLEVRGGMTG